MNALRRIAVIAVIAPLAVTLLAQGPGAQAPQIGIGEQLGIVGSLRDVRGSQRSLSDFQFSALVLFFAGTDCPVSERSMPAMIALEAQYRDRAKFVAVYPNEADTFGRIAGHAYDQDVPFLLLKDIGQGLSDRLGIERTGSVAILDGDLVLRYRGSLAGASGANSGGEEFVQALDQLLAGEDILLAETTGEGTSIQRESLDPRMADVTYSRDVAPILQRRCQVCHRPGQIGPFSLLDYRDAVQWKDMIHEVVSQRRMPPWQADPRYGKFSNDRSMPDDEVAIIRSWAENGAPRGNPADLPEPVAWTEGWLISEPDLVLYQPTPVDVPAEGIVNYIYQSAPLDMDEDIWIRQAELRPGNPSVVHHVIVYVRRPGERRLRFGSSSLVVWAPGDQPDIYPEGMALKVPAGSTLIWELHYTPNGVAVTDITSVGLVLGSEPPEREVSMDIFSKRRIRIEPGSPHHRHENDYTFKEDSFLVSLLPHMHLRGKSWKYTAVYPDRSTQIVLSVPRWDFNWQTSYFFAEPLFMPKGTVLKAVAHWDNSENNQANPDLTDEVTYGLQTFEEMMNGWVRHVSAKVDTPKNR